HRQHRRVCGPAHGGGRSVTKGWPGEKMNPVRPFTRNDIPQVVKLFQTVFFNNGQTAPSSSKLDAYFEEMFFHTPWTEKGAEKGTEEWAEEEIPTLVYEAGDGDIIGFIGIIPRRMLL